MRLERVDVSARAAVEEDTLVRMLEAVHRGPAFGRRRVAGKLLHEPLAVLVDDGRADANEAGLVQLGLIDERLLRERGLAVLDDPVVARSRPVEEVLAGGQPAVQILRREREDHLLARLVAERILVGRALDPRVVEHAAKRRERGKRGHHPYPLLHVFSSFSGVCIHVRPRPSRRPKLSVTARLTVSRTKNGKPVSCISTAHTWHE
jgi:hypothetical protein